MGCSKVGRLGWDAWFLIETLNMWAWVVPSEGIAGFGQFPSTNCTLGGQLPSLQAGKSGLGPRRGS